MRQDFGDALRIHPCFLREAFTKDKFEYALERMRNLAFEILLVARRRSIVDVLTWRFAHSAVALQQVVQYVEALTDDITGQQLGRRRMIIRVEPKDFFMSTILLLFDQGHPDPEDEEVKRYLAERALEPKRTFDTASQEQYGVVWQFGGCYLGRHLDAIANIQRKYLEAETLADEIPRLLKADATVEVMEAIGQLPDARLQELVDTLVKEFHQESAFGPDAEGSIKVILAPAVVQHRFTELLQSRIDQVDRRV